MKKWIAFLAALIWGIAVQTIAEEEAPWVTMENVREKSGYVWAQEPAQWNGAQEQGFEPVKMNPEEVYNLLKDAYDQGQDEATQKLLRSWGIELEPYGYPILRDVITEQEINRRALYANDVSRVRTISFSGWGWGEEGTLIFVEQWPDWYLWDYIPYECENFQLCGEDGSNGVFLEFSSIGHGTGCYVKDIAVYHLFHRKIESGYTVYGYEVFQNCGIQAYGAACYANDGVHIFRKLSPLIYDDEKNDYVPTGSMLDVFDYGFNEQGELQLNIGN